MGVAPMNPLHVIVLAANLTNLEDRGAPELGPVEPRSADLGFSVVVSNNLSGSDIMQPVTSGAMGGIRVDGPAAELPVVEACSGGVIAERALRPFTGGELKGKLGGKDPEGQAPMAQAYGAMGRGVCEAAEWVGSLGDIKGITPDNSIALGGPYLGGLGGIGWTPNCGECWFSFPGVLLRF